jgi:exopolysaccharide production protein ExoQ
MPPLLALLLCTIFVLWLLSLERKQTPDVSHVLWVPTVWLMYIISKPLGIWLESGGADMEAGSSLDRYFLSILSLIAVFILLKRKFNWGSAIKENKHMLLLIIFMLVSILWSDMMFVSFKRCARDLIAILMVFMIASESDPIKACESIFRRTIYALIPFSYILINYYPELGREYGRWSGGLMWIGVASQKNGLGRLCLFTAIFLIWAFIRRRQKNTASVIKHYGYVEVFILLLTFYLMGGPEHNFSYSATSNIAFVVGLIALISLYWKKKRNAEFIPKNLILVLLILIIIYGTATPFIGKLSLIDISSIVDRNETLTGRAEIWARLVPYAMQKPILGYGFGGFWTDSMRALTSSHAHNGYLDIVLNLGFLGLIIFIIFLISCVKKAQKIIMINFDWGVLLICFLLVIVVHNIAESSFTGFSSSLLAVIIFIIFSFSQSSEHTSVSKKN